MLTLSYATSRAAEVLLLTAALEAMAAQAAVAPSDPPKRGMRTTEIGTFTGTTPAALAAMIVARGVDMVYDGDGRKLKDTLTASGTSHAVTQYSYDVVGRMTCVAQRLNPATWAALPASACTLGATGSFGPDRITKSIRDSHGRVVQVQVALGTPEQAHERTLAYTFDALNRKLTETGQLGTATSSYNLAGRRTTLALPGGGITLTYDRDVLGAVTAIRENGATSGIGVLATYQYDSLGRRSSMTRGNGTSTSFAFDPVSRLASLTQDLASTVNDLTQNFTYNPASQIASLTRSNDLYPWTGHTNQNTSSVANGRNQLTSIGGVATAHDGRGNLTTDPTTAKTYGFASENMLTSATGGVTLAYDPILRLGQVAGAATTRFGYGGIDLLAEGNGTNAILRRYVPGPGVDEPIVWYEGNGTTDRRWFHADERGSVVAVSNASGASIITNRYDEYGTPQTTNAGRFQYTGQKWIGEIGLYDYKTRMYSPFAGGAVRSDRSDRVSRRY